MIRVFSLAAVLVVAIALAAWAQNVTRPSRPQRSGAPEPTLAPPDPAAGHSETPVANFDGADAPAEDSHRQSKTDPIPPNAVGLPHDVAPRHALASIAEGQLKLVRFSFETTQQEFVAKIEVGGKWTSESIIRTGALAYAHTSWHDVDGIRAYAGDEELDPLELAGKLAKATPVLIASKKVDRFYLEMFKEGTIQLILPASSIELNHPGTMSYGVQGYGAPVYFPAPNTVVQPVPAPVAPVPVFNQ